ncbi:MAG: hypothetical protein ACR2G4_16830 [Pyrinomonadaceae bacterium]
MSDYLWDKTGEPDEDAEQLEQLLGTLKYRPRPLEIPATVAALPARSRTIFFRPRLALAASLVLMLLAGTWLMMRQSEQATTPASIAEQRNSAPASGQPEIAKNSNGDAPAAGAVQQANKTKPRESRANVKQVKAMKPRRPAQQFIAKDKRQMLPRAGKKVLPGREEIAVTKEGREATEKLMLALRLASAKLNYAQREVYEIRRAGQ